LLLVAGVVVLQERHQAINVQVAVERAVIELIQDLLLRQVLLLQLQSAQVELLVLPQLRPVKAKILFSQLLHLLVVAEADHKQDMD
jgi:hypothetical protein